MENVYLNENLLEQIPIDILDNPNLKVIDLEHNNLLNSTEILSQVANHDLKSGSNSRLTTINLKNNVNVIIMFIIHHKHDL